MPHPLDLADAITRVLLFLLAVFLLGLLVGLAHMCWRARQDRLEREKEDEGLSAPTPAPLIPGRATVRADVAR